MTDPNILSMNFIYIYIYIYIYNLKRAFLYFSHFATPDIRHKMARGHDTHVRERQGEVEIERQGRVGLW